ncbi:hypothetical protein OFY17_09005 [Marinomonas sp. C2222]|uniref:Uncharacterized protein n=1 Tax=Marinomonas sargassi TaxID=2984494 RepID=A0ABT2YSY2_9GAMM|nr:hypothetical protein [Marinomonas sargassi]MCV2403013.1 hypothetical protein [Marinomonas sargassi]
MLFFPTQEDLDCISDSGVILGKIKFCHEKSVYAFHLDGAAKLAKEEELEIAKKLAELSAGEHLVPMQDDD